MSQVPFSYNVQCVGKLVQRDPRILENLVSFSVGVFLPLQNGGDAPSIFEDVLVFDADWMEVAKTLAKGDMVELSGAVQYMNKPHSKTGEMEPRRNVCVLRGNPTHYVKRYSPKERR